MTKHLTEPHRREETASTDELLAAVEPVAVSLELAEIGKTIKIRPITMADRQKAKSAATDTRTGKIDEQSFQATIIVLCVVEPKLSPEHIARMMNGNVKVVDHIARGIYRLSGIEFEKDKDAAKNASATTSREGTSTSSLAT